MDYLIIETLHEGYGLEQIRKTLTVGELIELLSKFDEDTPVYLSFDNGYTYGGITESRVEIYYSSEEDD